MESLLGGFQLPLQRRLTKMYTDTKSSYDFVKDPVQAAEIPELSSLYRKLRIQKDRLISWGLGWCDPTESPDIDESLSKAGLSDVVGSVMSTIKDILAEAEPLWQSSKRVSEPSRGSEKAGDQKLSLVVWDRSRFEDLVRDLTSSIDTLYDLSSTRKSGHPTMKHASPSSSFQAKLAAAEAERKFESTRMKTPQQIDPSTLITDPTDPKSTILYSSLAGTFPVGLAGSRQIVYARRQQSSNNPWKHGGPPPIIPVLLEYAPYDPIFANTGVTPSMNRFEKLFAGLQMGQGATGRPESRVLNLIGYFEEPLQSHFGLLYELPNRFSPDVDGPETPVMPYAATLADLLSDEMFEPTLEVKFRLACNLAMTVFDLHSKGIIHGNIAASNVVFFDQQSAGTKDEDALSKINVRQAFVTSFDLFPDYTSRQEASGVDSSEMFLYRSPIDPRVTNLTVLSHESRSLDVYSLAMLLLEIGLWTPLRDIFPPHLGIPDDTTQVYKQVAARCGTKYLAAVKACWRAVDEEMSSVSRPEVALQKIYGQVVQALEGCCMIEDGLEQEEISEVNTLSPIPPQIEQNTKGSEATTPNVTAGWPKLNEQQRAMDVLSNVIKARDAHYRKKASTPSPADLPAKSNVQKDTLNQSILAIPVKKNEYPREKVGITQASAEKPSKNMEPTKLGQAKLIVIIVAPQVREETSPRPKMRIFRSIKVSQEHLDYWHTVLMQQINYALRGFYRKYPESVEISLESIGENLQNTKPTILVVCTSVGRVRSILKRSFEYDSSTYGLLVCKGRILRSRKDRPKRSMAGEGVSTLIAPLNKEYQERPLNGASIGAYIDGNPLPPVSFGGVIMIDDKPYGLTVHHMLDDPEDADDDTRDSQPPTLRSSDHVLHLREGEAGLLYDESMDYDDFDCEVSESGSDTSSIMSNYSEDDGQGYDEFAQPTEPGDIEGIPQGCGAGYHVTQPAIDDVDQEIFPSEVAAEEDFLDTFKLGEIYASSGLRRRYEQGVAHEIDWALFEFEEDRLPPGNHIKDGAKHCCLKSPYPVKIAPWSKLHDLEVHCMARTTGLQTGHILPGMSIVKIFGRQTPSQSYQVSGRLGMPGDSGAWLIDNKEGRACGHVLAWSSRKKVAYICPMEILISDIADTLDARTVCFPSASVVRINTLTEAEAHDGSSIGQISALDENPPTPLPDEPIQVGNLKSPMTVRYAIAGDDNIVAAMDAIHVSPSVISQG
jgi:hypothetical protein